MPAGTWVTWSCRDALIILKELVAVNMVGPMYVAVGPWQTNRL